MREKKWKIGKYKKLREKKCGNLAKKSFDKNGPFFSNNFSPDFPLFFPRKTGKAGNISIVWKLNRGQHIWKKKKKIWKY